MRAGEHEQNQETREVRLLEVRHSHSPLRGNRFLVSGNRLMVPSSLVFRKPTITALIAIFDAGTYCETWLASEGTRLTSLLNWSGSLLRPCGTQPRRKNPIEIGSRINEKTVGFCHDHFSGMSKFCVGDQGTETPLRLRPGLQRNHGYSRRDSEGPAQQGGMRHRDSFGAEVCLWRGGRLRTRRNHLPHRPAFYREMERAYAVCAGRGKHRISDRWRGDGLRSAGDEPEGRELDPRQQSEVGRRCFSSRRTEGTYRGGGYRHRDESGGAQLLAGARLICGRFAGGLDASVGRERQPQAVRAKPQRQRDCSGREGRSAGGGQRMGIVVR